VTAEEGERMNPWEVSRTAGPSRRVFLRNAGALLVGFSMAGRGGKLLAQNPIDPTGLVDATQGFLLLRGNC
jgi:hypothetical protein